MDYLKIGSFLQALRKERGLTQSDLANQFEISNKTVSKWECGTALPELPMLKALAEFYNVTVDEILKGCKNDKSDEIIENNKKVNDDFIISQKQQKLDFWMLISILTLYFGFIMVYVLGYTIKRADIPCFTSIVIYFISLSFFFIGKLKLGKITNFDKNKIIALNNRRFHLYTLYFLSFLYVFIMTVLFYALPKSVTYRDNVILTITSYLSYSLLGLFILVSIYGLIIYAKNSNSNIYRKINKIMNISYIIIISIFLFCCSYFEYISAFITCYKADYSDLNVRIDIAFLDPTIDIFIIIGFIIALIIVIILFIKKTKLIIIPKIIIFLTFFITFLFRTYRKITYITNIFTHFYYPEEPITRFIISNTKYTFMLNYVIIMLFLIIPLYIIFDIISLIKNKKYSNLISN